MSNRGSSSPYRHGHDQQQQYATQEQHRRSHRTYSPPTTTSAVNGSSAAAPQQQQGAEAQESAPVHRRVNSLSSYSTTSISKHYALNNQILSAFDSCYEQKLYQVAYAVGLQFVETALLEIPKHGYYYSSRHEEERSQSAQQALRVSQLLETILQEELRATSDQSVLLSDGEDYKVARLKHLAQEQEFNLESFEHERELVEQELQKQKMLGSGGPSSAGAGRNGTLDTFCAKLFDYADVVNDAICPAAELAQQPHHHHLVRSTSIATGSFPEASNTGPSRRKSGSNKDNMMMPPPAFRSSKTESHAMDSSKPPESEKKTGSSAAAGKSSLRNEAADWYRLDDVVDGEPTPTIMDKEWGSSLGGPNEQYELCRDASEYRSSVASDSDLRQSASLDKDLERALWLSGLSRAENEKSKKHRKKSTGDEIDIQSLQFCYHEDFDLLRETRRVRITRLTTHQGRLPGSINGCTVIAPLLCIHHFLNFNNPVRDPYHGGALPDMGLADDTMEDVIDSETAAILPEVRTNLGLTKDAMIIPSDVHDYLIDKKLLSQEQFVSVTGGNILDNEHVDSFLSCLRAANAAGSKLDGKKIAATLFFHEHVITILKLKQHGPNINEFWYDWIDSLPSERFLRRTVEFEEASFVRNAARIRCVDEEALKSTLLWYACSKFTDDNRAYIDAYAWDENDTDFDPRVFQAFVWSEL